MLQPETGKRLAVGASFLFVSLFANCLSQVLIEIHWKSHAPTPRLHDFIFSNVPRIPNPQICDWLMYITGTITLLPLLLLHPRRSLLARRFLAFQGSIFFLRAISIVVTILPPPLPECVPDPIAGSVEENVLKEVFRVMTGLRVTCGDCLFSGHAANVTLLTAFGLKYGQDLFPSLLALRLYKTALSCLLAVSLTAIVVTWFHYTVDVLVSLLVVSYLWTLYHNYLQSPAPHRLLVWYDSLSSSKDVACLQQIA